MNCVLWIETFVRCDAFRLWQNEVCFFNHFPCTLQKVDCFTESNTAYGGCLFCTTSIIHICYLQIFLACIFIDRRYGLYSRNKKIFKWKLSHSNDVFNIGIPVVRSDISQRFGTISNILNDFKNSTQIPESTKCLCLNARVIDTCTDELIEN